MRLNKFLVGTGVCSRKQADQLIIEKRVKVNNQLAQLGQQVSEQDQVTLDDLRLETQSPLFYLYYKPVGVVCTHDLAVENNLVAAVEIQQRLFSVGRLDKDSEGLLLLTNQGDLANQILQPTSKHRKTYQVTVDKDITKAFVYDMASGVAVLDTVTLPCEVTALNARVFEIVLTQGLNRQIRRMCQALGYRVEKLQRTKIMFLTLCGLQQGEIRPLTMPEQQRLLDALNPARP